MWFSTLKRKLNKAPKRYEHLPKSFFEEYYPFMKNSNGHIFTDANLPRGWRVLYITMCQYISDAAKERGYNFENFFVLDVKEKYGEMRVYTAYPKEASFIGEIIDKFSYMSNFICAQCGKIAKYDTTGWTLPICKDCITYELVYPKRYKLKRYYYTIKKEYDRNLNGIAEIRIRHDIKNEFAYYVDYYLPLKFEK